MKEKDKKQIRRKMYVDDVSISLKSRVKIFPDYACGVKGEVPCPTF